MWALKNLTISVGAQVGYTCPPGWMKVLTGDGPFVDRVEGAVLAAGASGPGRTIDLSGLLDRFLLDRERGDRVASSRYGQKRPRRRQSLGGVDTFGSERGLARSTVLTMMERLRKKGHLGRRLLDGDLSIPGQGRRPQTC